MDESSAQSASHKEAERLRAILARAAAAIEALYCAQMRWGDNGLQTAEANRMAASVLAEIRGTQD
jgi:hypothetical protein